MDRPLPDFFHLSLSLPPPPLHPPPVAFSIMLSTLVAASLVTGALAQSSFVPLASKRFDYDNLVRRPFAPFLYRLILD